MKPNQPSATLMRTPFSRQPARGLLLDLSGCFDDEICQKLCDALENVLSLICHMSGASRIPYISLVAMTTYPEVLLPMQPVRGNLGRIQSSLCALKELVDRGTYAGSRGNTLSETCLCQALQDMCGQFRRQVKATFQTAGYLGQLEVTMITTQTAGRLARQTEKVVRMLDAEHLKRIQVLSITNSNDMMIFDESVSPVIGASQTSSDSGITSLIDQLQIDNDLLCLQNYFSGWLHDSCMDSEHLRIHLPHTDNQGEACSPLVLKCDLYERLINPGHLPAHHAQFGIQVEAQCTRPLQSGSKNLPPVPIYKLKTVSLAPTSSICESIVFGMPIVAQATSCWKFDWDDLERNQQNFIALCQTLSQNDQVMIAHLMAETGGKITPGKGSVYPSQFSPRGYFAIFPAPNGTLLIKSLGVMEICLPGGNGLHGEKATEERMELVKNSLSKLSVTDMYNPLLTPSGLYEALKISNNRDATGGKFPRSKTSNEQAETESGRSALLYSAPAPVRGGKRFCSGTRKLLPLQNSTFPTNL